MMGFSVCLFTGQSFILSAYGIQSCRLARRAGLFSGSKNTAKRSWRCFLTTAKKIHFPLMHWRIMSPQPVPQPNPVLPGRPPLPRALSLLRKIPLTVLPVRLLQQPPPFSLRPPWPLPQAMPAPPVPSPVLPGRLTARPGLIYPPARCRCYPPLARP